MAMSDVYLNWFLDGTATSIYVCVHISYDFFYKAAWGDLRDNDMEVQWSKLVWYSQGIPSHMFIVWMAVNERLQTQDRIMRWNNDANIRYPLCKN
ncbi:hypothetical protein CTI12_AA247190 [Artemisia annua]|uniref:Reverse transcriptase zinc-binding domain-containing protein n=1 Tax=Artemisia annua TaxID=35608 RepID=A0A2U1NN62_ARTAN|nr:hypothetical protein CTI12_AA247190 [Artemisia annua]